MFDSIHPIVVHFPIALLLVALAFELVRARRADADWAVDALIALGALGAIAAATTGEAALSSMKLPDLLHAAAENHENAGSIAAWIAGGALLCRIMYRLSGVPRRTAVPSPTAQRRWRGLSTFLLAFAVAVTLRAAYLGGYLVHDLGVTRATMPAREQAAPPSPSTYEAEPDSR